MSESYLASLKELMLVRFLSLPKKSKPGPAKIYQDMYSIFEEACPAPNAFNSLVETALTELDTESLIERKPFKLTETGCKRALHYLGVSEVPHNITWSRLRDVYLTAKVFGLDVNSTDVGKQLKNLDRVKGHAVKHNYGLNFLPNMPTLKQATDALLWQQSGIETSVTFNEKNALQHFLEMDLAERSSLNAKLLRGVIAKKATKAHGNRGDEMRRRIIQQLPEKRTDKDNVTTDNDKNLNTTDKIDQNIDLEAFAREVQRIAKTSISGKFGEHKVFINHVWQNMQQTSLGGTLNLPKFKDLLTNANKQGLLTLSRADMVAAMDATDVAESEIQYLNATFHFIQI